MSGVEIDYDSFSSYRTKIEDIITKPYYKLPVYGFKIKNFDVRYTIKRKEDRKYNRVEMSIRVGQRGCDPSDRKVYEYEGIQGIPRCITDGTKAFLNQIVKSAGGSDSLKESLQKLIKIGQEYDRS